MPFIANHSGWGYLKIKESGPGWGTRGEAKRFDSIDDAKKLLKHWWPNSYDVIGQRIKYEKVDE